MSGGFFFAKPENFILLFAVPPALILVILHRAKRRGALKKLTRSRYKRFAALGVIRSVSWTLCWIFLTAALAEPHWGIEKSVSRKYGAAAAFVFDISASMRVADVYPDRLSLASRYASSLLDLLNGVPCSAVLLKGRGVLAVPLTYDRIALQNLFDILDPSLLGAPGTDIAGGVECAVSSFAQNSAAARTVIVFTDGEELAGDVLQAVRRFAASGVSFVFIGIGTEEGGYVPTGNGNFLAGADGNPVRSRLNAAVFSALEALPNVYYERVESAGSAIRALNVIQAAQSPQFVVYEEKPKNRASLFAAAAFILFCLGCAVGLNYD